MAESPRRDPVTEWTHRICDALDAAGETAAAGGDPVQVFADLMVQMRADSRLSQRERRTVLTLVGYELAYRDSERMRKSPVQKTAMKLLRSYLTPGQRRTLSNRSYFHVQGSSGSIYRLCTRTGAVQRVEQRGSRYWWLATFCYHDEAPEGGRRLPLPDLALQQMLLLLCDEPAFLSEANLSCVSRRVQLEPWVLELEARTEARRLQAMPARVDGPRIRVCLDDDMQQGAA